MMQIMDKHLLNHPAEGLVSMVDMLKKMGHQTLYRKKNLTKGALKEFI